MIIQSMQHVELINVPPNNGTPKPADQLDTEFGLGGGASNRLRDEHQALLAMGAGHPLLSRKQEKELSQELQAAYFSLAQTVLAIPATYKVMEQDGAPAASDLGSQTLKKLMTRFSALQHGKLTEQSYQAELVRLAERTAPLIEEIFSKEKEWRASPFWLNSLNTVASRTLNELQNAIGILNRLAQHLAIDTTQALTVLNRYNEIANGDRVSLGYLTQLRDWEKCHAMSVAQAVNSIIRLEAALSAVNQPRDMLIRSNVRLVASVINKMLSSNRGRFGLMRGVRREDLYQAGLIGLLRGIDGFDPNRGLKLSTYAIWWISQTVVKEVHELSEVISTPMKLVEPAAAVAGRERDRRMRGLPVDDETLIAELKISKSDLNRIRKAERARAVARQGNGRSDDDDRETAPWDLDCARVRSNSASTPISVEELSRKIRFIFQPRDVELLTILYGLPNLDYSDVVTAARCETAAKRYNRRTSQAGRSSKVVVKDGGATLEVTGRALGITRERVRQIRTTLDAVLRDLIIALRAEPMELRRVGYYSLSKLEIALVGNVLRDEPKPLESVKAALCIGEDYYPLARLTEERARAIVRRSLRTTASNLRAHCNQEG